MPTLPRLWIPFALLGLLFLTLSGTPAWSRPPDPEAPPEVLPACTDVLRCQLAREIAYTDRFLRERRYGLPFTLDPRPLDYPLEMLRLNVMSQAMGYLNLYRFGHRTEHYREALARLDYLLSLGDAALGNGPRDGMYGYLMLDAYDLLREERFLTAGRRAGARCVQAQTDFNLTMNGGLMCALNHAFLARLDGSVTSAAIADGIVDRTAPKQFEDGAFPHQPFLASGRNTNYSAWMANELLMLRSLRPSLELTEYLAVNTIEFLQRRVGPDGLLVYRDSLFDYASDPGGGDTRGWTSELASVGLDLAVSGHRDDAARVLSRLFAMCLKGDDLGGYPDKYAFVDHANPWETGRPSVLRTSLVFWLLTLIRRYDLPCAGPSGSCVPVGEECTQLYRDLGLCDGSIPGRRLCVAGQRTRCFEPTLVRMRANRLCGLRTACVWLPEGICHASCPTLGSAWCVGDSCRQLCQDTWDGECDVDCDSREVCDEYDAGIPVEAARNEARQRPKGLPFDVETNDSFAARRDDLSLQLLRVNGVGSGEAVLRAHHHGTRPALGARLTLSRANGDVLTSRSFVLPPHSSVELKLPCTPCDSLVARLDAGGAFEELDTLNNVVRALSSDPAVELRGVYAAAAPAPGAMPVLRPRGGLRFDVWTSRDARMQLSVHDVVGRRVRLLWDGLLPQGTRAFEWDGVTSTGRRAERGVYFVRLVTAEAQLVTRVVILR
ncbi:MAG: hypothetical protein IT348_13165 [Candidatus Eisenbacteria bacterium]|nr:hypothetical protein [Candidatus Eisenbacteria bacterium]